MKRHSDLFTAYPPLQFYLFRKPFGIEIEGFHFLVLLEGEH